jgi:hypothetical protein
VAGRGTRGQIDAVMAAAAALETPVPGRARLHCSLLLVPGKVAEAHRLELGTVVTGDGSEWAALTRDAIAAKGRLHNLPEVLAAPLEPFTRSAAPGGERAPAPAERAPELRVRGQVVPLGGGEVAVALDVTRARREAPLARPVFRLGAGRAAMLAAREGTDVLVVVVRCVEIDAPATK